MILNGSFHQYNTRTTIIMMTLMMMIIQMETQHTHTTNPLIAMKIMYEKSENIFSVLINQSTTIIDNDVLNEEFFILPLVIYLFVCYFISFYLFFYISLVVWCVCVCVCLMAKNGHFFHFWLKRNEKPLKFIRSSLIDLNYQYIIAFTIR